MSLTSAAILLGLVVGSWASGVVGWFFWFSRPYRWARNLLVIGAGYIVIGFSSLGSLFLLGESLERMGIAQTPQGKAALYAWTASLVCGLGLVFRSELKWRKSAAIDDKKLMPPHEKKN